MKKGRLSSVLCGVYVVCSMLYLYVPLLVLIVMGFNRSKYNSLPFELSLRWYEALAENRALIQSCVNSLYLAAITGAACAILATMMLLGNPCLPRRLKNLAESLMNMPLSIPWLVLGLSLLLMLRSVDMSKNLPFLLLGHIVVSFPYSALVLRSRMQSMDPALEEASASLGATAMTTFRRVTLPVIAPAVVAGGFLSFMISFGNFAISYFLIPVGMTTLPIEVNTSIKFGFTPEINAISTIVVGITVLCLALIGTILGSGIKSLFGGRK